MEVRRARAGDVPAVVTLVTRTLAEFGIVFGVGSTTDAQLLALPASYEDAGGAFFVVELDGALVGTAGIYRQSTASYELRKMYLDGAARGHGAGQRLLEACVGFVREQGGRRVVLDTTEQMTAAIAFYEKNGFVRDAMSRSPRRAAREGYRLEALTGQRTLTMRLQWPSDSEGAIESLGATTRRFRTTEVTIRDFKMSRADGGTELWPELKTDLEVVRELRTPARGTLYLTDVKGTAPQLVGLRLAGQAPTFDDGAGVDSQ